MRSKSGVGEVLANGRFGADDGRRAMLIFPRDLG